MTLPSDPWRDGRGGRWCKRNALTTGAIEVASLAAHMPVATGLVICVQYLDSRGAFVERQSGFVGRLSMFSGAALLVRPGSHLPIETCSPAPS